jgi:hypothetical protein
MYSKTGQVITIRMVTILEIIFKVNFSQTLKKILSPSYVNNYQEGLGSLNS